MVKIELNASQVRVGDEVDYDTETFIVDRRTVLGCGSIRFKFTNATRWAVEDFDANDKIIVYYEPECA